MHSRKIGQISEPATNIYQTRQKFVKSLQINSLNHIEILYEKMPYS